MYFASQNFPKRSALARAVEAGAPVVLFNPELQMPAVNGTHTVVGPWGIAKWDATRGVRHGWSAQVRVQDMRIVEVR